MTQTLDTDYLVVGAGAMGMAFTDALVDHADVHVTIADRRLAPGGHWQDAYPFVRLHQASVFYGVASAELGTGAIQQSGPEVGLHERAGADEIRDYYGAVLQRRVDSGRVAFLGGHEYQDGDGAHHVISQVSGVPTRVKVRRRVVDATYLQPTIPATTPPPFDVTDDAPVVAVNALASLVDVASRFVIVGSGKTATDAIVWLLGTGVDPDDLTWVCPRDPWMLDRATVQPDPVVMTALATDTMAAAAEAGSLEDMFLRLEAAGVMLRIDPTVTPTMARTPTLGRWELDLLRTVEDVVRMGHVRSVSRRELVLDRGAIPLDEDALVVHCAASGLASPPMVPIWSPDRIRLQTIRAGFPCFCAALAGYVEATRDDDRERNRVCPPNSYGNSLAQWAGMTARGAAAVAAYGAEPDIAAWSDTCLLNPSRVPEERRDDPALATARARLAVHAERGLARMAELARKTPPG